MKIFLLTTFTIFSLSIAHAESTQLCGQNVEYKMVAPAKDVPNELKAFMGIWVGNLKVTKDNTPCTAFVIEQVEANGRVVVHQAWSGVGMTEKKYSDTATYLGRIENGTLTLVGYQIVYQLNLDAKNAKKLGGSVIDIPFGKFAVDLTKAQ